MGIAHWKVSVGYGVLQAVVGIGALSFYPFYRFRLKAVLGKSEKRGSPNSKITTCKEAKP